MQMADCNQARQKVGRFFRIRLVEHPLISFAGGTRLIGIDSRHQDHLIPDSLLDGHQTADVITHRLLIVRRAGADNDYKPVAPPTDGILQLPILLFLALRHFRGNRIQFLDLLRSG